MITGLIGFVLGCIVTALVYRNNIAKATAAVDKGVAGATSAAEKAKAKLN